MAVAVVAAVAAAYAGSGWFAPAYVGGNLSQLEVLSSDQPRPGPEEVLVRVLASSVNPIDWKVVSGDLRKDFPLRFPQRLGCDVAGRVLAVGDRTTGRIRVGDAVWANLGVWTPTAQMGAYSDTAVASEEQVSVAPASLPPLQSAALPLVAQTMIQALNDALSTGAPSPAVFITSGTGGTGTAGIQISKAGFNASWVGTCSDPAREGLVRELGADFVVDYTSEHWYDRLANGSVDVFIDNYGEAATPQRAMAKLRPGGAFVSLAHAVAPDPPLGIRQYALICNASRHAELDTAAALVDAGKLRPVVQQTFNVTDLLAAFNVSMAGGVVGKLVLDVRF